MGNIKLEISNPNNVAYKSIVLRKFFYMVFIDASGKKICVYTATIFGSTDEDVGDSSKAYSSIKYDSDVPCSLQFNFTDDNEDLIDKISFFDKTDSFCRQHECIGKVWGTCEKLDTQKAVLDKRNEIYPDFGKSANQSVPNSNAERPVLYIKQGDNQSHKCIAIRGDFSNSEFSSSYSYILSSPSDIQNSCLAGIEFVNWIKTEIELKTSILNKRVNFSIAFKDKGFLTPDFTWYFAPPAGYIVSSDSYVRVGEKYEEKNAIQSVSDETTVPFEEWISSPESIDERRKSRVLIKAAPVTHSERLAEDKTLSVNLQVVNPQGPSNRQFFIGLLVAFLLSFCSDKTRVDYFFSCISTNCVCAGKCICQNVCNAISVIVPVLLLLSFVSYILTPHKAFPPKPIKHHKLFSICRLVGLCSVALLVVYVYFLWLVFPGLMSKIFNCFWNIVFLSAFTIMGTLGNTIYLAYCLGKLKRKVYNYL